MHRDGAPSSRTSSLPTADSSTSALAVYLHRDTALRELRAEISARPDGQILASDLLTILDALTSHDLDTTTLQTGDA